MSTPPTAASLRVTLTDGGREKLAAWTTAHERRVDAALAALDDGARAAITNALPALFQPAEHLGESADARRSSDRESVRSSRPMST
ncbi:hypothetical protein ACWEWG_00485 [Streptomyces sp. NPDC003758]|uniref:MarR family transcriptional regulator n=1 Tax=Streptomyces cynarae TaxID=2981134 RepID=A0ABY6EDJ1_9ACTN|nr:hypothetical protein [Streptomyces cynarae]UXY24829.1 hypothetical protein N8I84_02255 [Streptomyces cynarae]